MRGSGISNHSRARASAPLDEVAPVEAMLRDAAEAAGATVLNVRLHHFGPGQGVTGVAILAESHISIHTWPEKDYAAVDIFMCGNCDPANAEKHIIEKLLPKKTSSQTLRRGKTE